MSPFPPGMQTLDWEHIEGSEHWTGCPQHEDQPETDPSTDSGQALPCLCDVIEAMWREDAADMRADEAWDDRYEGRME